MAPALSSHLRLLSASAPSCLCLLWNLRFGLVRARKCCWCLVPPRLPRCLLLERCLPGGGPSGSGGRPSRWPLDGALVAPSASASSVSSLLSSTSALTSSCLGDLVRGGRALTFADVCSSCLFFCQGCWARAACESTRLLVLRSRMSKALQFLAISTTRSSATLRYPAVAQLSFASCPKLSIAVQSLHHESSPDGATLRHLAQRGPRPAM